MKTTLEISDSLYRQAKVKAAMDGRKMKDLVAEGLALVLALPGPTDLTATSPISSDRLKKVHKQKVPPWFGILAPYVRRSGVASDMTSIRASIARGMVAERQL